MYFFHSQNCFINGFLSAYNLQLVECAPNCCGDPRSKQVTRDAQAKQ